MRNIGFLIFFIIHSNVLFSLDSLAIKIDCSWVKNSDPDILVKDAEKYLDINLDTSLAYSKKLLSLSNKNLTYKTKSYLFLGKALSRKGAYEDASIWLLIGIKDIGQKDKYLKALLYQELGNHEKIRRNYEISLEYLLKALFTFEKLQRHEKQAELHINIAEFQRNIKKYADAEKHIETALQICNKNNIKNKTLAYLYNRAAAIKIETGIIKESIEYSFKALEVAKKNNLRSYMATSYNELGYIFHNINDPRALDYYFKALYIWKKSGAYRYMVSVQINIGRYYATHKNYRLTEKTLQEAKRITDKYGWIGLNMNIYKILYEMYEAKKDFEKAFKYKELYSQLHEKELNREHSSKVEEIHTKYESEKNKLLLSEKEKEIELAKIVSEQRKVQRNSIAITSVILVILLMVVIYSHIKIQKSKLKISENKRQIEKINFVLNKEVQKKEALLKELNHRVKNNLTILSGLFHLQEAEVTAPETLNILKESQVRIKSMAMIHQNLYQQDDAHSIDMNEYYEKLGFELIHSLAPKGKKIMLDLKAKEVKLELLHAIPLTLIINELITNACKYAFVNLKEGIIKLNLSIKDNFLNASFSDNGVGLSNNLDLENINSFGLKLIKLLVTQLDGKIRYNFDNGATFTIDFPLAITE